MRDIKRAAPKAAVAHAHEERDDGPMMSGSARALAKWRESGAVYVAQR